MYPNPVSKTLFIETARNISKPIRYRFYDMTGNIVSEGTSTRDKLEVNVQGLKLGVYVVRLYNNHDVELYSEKVVIL